MRLLLYLWTIRYLRTIQIYARLRSSLWRPGADLRPAPVARTPRTRIVDPILRPSAWRPPSRFCFLNEEHEVIGAAQWNDERRAKLWLYHLHYLDDLNALPDTGSPNPSAELLTRWVRENPPGQGVGWEPYPCSRRIVNCIKWALRGNELSAECAHSVAVQARWLEQRLEWHLLGNHLLANAKALVFAGTYFTGEEAERWRALGLQVLAQQIAEQILDDGGHYELSPMYHALLLEDFLDIVNLLRAYRCEPPHWLLSKLGAMRSWLAAMVHPDGGIAFFNDAALDGAPSRAAIEAYAARLGLTERVQVPADLADLRDSGYVRATCGPAVLLADMAPVGPDCMPGHAHADSLSFELSLHGRRVLVNSGTSIYGTSDERVRQRATPAHNTVALDGMNSSEIWSGFRVARRARVIERRAEAGREVVLAGAHDGYTRLAGRPVHRREWRLQPGGLHVIDRIEGSGPHSIDAAFHFHPDVVVTPNGSGSFELRSRYDASPASFSVDAPAECELQPSTYHPRFGVSQRNLKVSARVEGELPLVVHTRIRWQE